MTPDILSRRALGYFLNYNSMYQGATRMSASEFVEYIDNEWPNFRKFFGEALQIANLKDTELRDLMEQVASEYKGKLPTIKDLSIFNEALVDDSMSWRRKASQLLEGASKGFSELKNVGVSTAGISTAVIAVAVLMYLSSKRR